MKQPTQPSLSSQAPFFFFAAGIFTDQLCAGTSGTTLTAQHLAMTDTDTERLLKALQSSYFDSNYYEPAGDVSDGVRRALESIQSSGVLTLVPASASVVTVMQKFAGNCARRKAAPLVLQHVVSATSMVPVERATSKDARRIGHLGSNAAANTAAEGRRSRAP